MRKAQEAEAAGRHDPRRRVEGAVECKAARDRALAICQMLAGAGGRGDDPRGDAIAEAAAAFKKFAEEAYRVARQRAQDVLMREAGLGPS